jgi:sugar lactone lactonase YvrE
MLQYGRWLIFAAVLLVMPTLAQDATQEATAEPVTLPEVITFTSPIEGLQPEGVEWDAAHARFLVGSLAHGTIHSITVAEDGTPEVEPFIEDEDLVATVGLEIDKVNNRLLVVNSNRSAFNGGAGAAGLAAYDLETGERAFFVDLADLYESTTHFTNDVTVDAEGNAYVTNSTAPVLYKVTPDGEASVLIEDELLGSRSFGANGIVYHPDGYLLVANAASMSLLKVSLGDAPEITPVEMDSLFSADGLVLAEDGTLYAVTGTRPQSVLSVVSEDGWETATVESSVRTTGPATTITLVGDTPYYINAYLGSGRQTEYEINAFVVEAE